MFRRTLTAAAILAFATVLPAVAQDATDYLGVPGPIEVGGTEYFLAWSSNPGTGYFKQEYLPAGAVPESYQSMVIVEFLATDMALTDVISAQTAMVEQRKGTDPVANWSVLKNDDGSEYVLDFLLSAKDENGEFILEWNGYRYFMGEHDGQPGSVLFAVSERAYGDDASKEFLGGLRDFKAQRTLDLTNAEKPEFK